MRSALENEELGWSSRPLAELMRLAWPITISTLSYAVMTLVSTIFVGRLGPAALAGVGLGATACFAILCFSFGLLRGAKVLVSQARGAGDREAPKAFLGASILLGGALGLVSIVLTLVTAIALPWVAESAEAGEHARVYFIVRMLSAPFLLVYVGVREVRYGLGDARTPMLAALVGNVLNVVLDYVLIFGENMGVVGAAWATVAAHGAELFVLLLVQWREGLTFRHTRMSHVLAVWRIGVPSGLQFMLEMGSFAMMAGMLAKLSDLQMGAHLIVLQVVHFSFLPATAVGEAASVMAGEAVGARRSDMVNPLARLALWVAGSYTGFCALVMVLGRHLIGRAFTGDPLLLELTGQLMLVAAGFQIFDAANIIARTVLRGTGDVKVPAAICILATWVSLPPLTWLLGYQAGWGALGAWLGITLEILLTSGILWWRLHREHWRAVTPWAGGPSLGVS